MDFRVRRPNSWVALDALTHVTNNTCIVRKVVALALSVAIQAAGLSAPFVHAHPDDHDTDHHAGRAVHTHWASHGHAHHAADTPAFESVDEDRAVFLNAFVAVTVLAMASPVVVSVAVELSVPPERAAHRVIEIEPGHDPPARRSLASRAPPVFLS